MQNESIVQTLRLMTGSLKDKRKFSTEIHGTGFVKHTVISYFELVTQCNEVSVMKRLLIVDDDPDHRFILRTVFEAKGYTCVEAIDGEDALTALNTYQIALVLTDLKMPRMNGIQLIDQMQTSASTRSIPVILLTAQFNEDRGIRAYLNRVCVVMEKPYNVSDLLSSVRSALEAHASCEMITTTS